MFRWGVRPGDIIIKVNTKPVYCIQDIITKVSSTCSFIFHISDFICNRCGFSENGLIYLNWYKKEQYENC